MPRKLTRTGLLRILRRIGKQAKDHPGHIYGDLARAEAETALLRYINDLEVTYEYLAILKRVISER